MQHYITSVLSYFCANRCFVLFPHDNSESRSVLVAWGDDADSSAGQIVL